MIALFKWIFFILMSLWGKGGAKKGWRLDPASQSYDTLRQVIHLRRNSDIPPETGRSIVWRRGWKRFVPKGPPGRQLHWYCLRARTKEFSPARDLNTSNSMCLKSGLCSCSQTPRNSIVSLFLNQFWITVSDFKLNRAEVAQGKMFYDHIVVTFDILNFPVKRVGRT